MSGIMENILQVLQSIDGRLAAAANGGVKDATSGAQLASNGPLVAVAELQSGSMGNATPVSADQLTALIMPHISNETIKTALGAAMRALGVNNLPEAQPHQYAPLFASFQQVLAAHGIGGVAPVNPPGAASSII